MTYTAREVLEFVRENDVKFVKLSFCDLLGVQKNISIMAGELERAMEQGISFDAAAIRGFLQVEKSDLFLRPDPGTMRILPWRPQHGRVMRLFCDIAYPDGTPFEGDTRHILSRGVERAAGMGFSCEVGVECEFYLFRTDELGNPTREPFDRAGYLDISPLDRCEKVRREICLTLEQMGIPPEISHHEQGPGQNEVDFRFGDILTAADDLLEFKSAVKAVAASNGLFASFLPKPLENESGSGLHVNMSLAKDGANIFTTRQGEHSPEAESFIAGVLARVREITAVLNPIGNSYARLGSCEAPKYVSWSHQNRSQLVRIPAARGNNARMELRSPDPACNPHLAFALLLHAGLDGIAEKLPLPAPRDYNMYSATPEQLEGLEALPGSLEEALDLLEGSAFARKVLGGDVLGRYLELKGSECAVRAAGNAGDIDTELYFPVV